MARQMTMSRGTRTALIVLAVIIGVLLLLWLGTFAPFEGSGTS